MMGRAIFTFVPTFCTRASFHHLRSSSSPLFSSIRQSRVVPVPGKRSFAVPKATVSQTTESRALLDTDHAAPVCRPSQGALVSISTAPKLSELSCELLVLAVKSSDADEWALPSELAQLDTDSLQGALSESVSDTDFSGKAGSSSEMLRVVGASIKRVILYGLGEGGPNDAAKAAAFAVTKGKDISSCDSVALYLECLGEGYVARVAESASVAAFTDERFKGDISDEKKKKIPPKELVIVGTGSVNEAELNRGHAIAAGVIATKEVVAAPANSLTPESLADAARLVAKEANLSIKVLGRDECKKLGMGCFLGVSQGSLREPQFIHMTYTPEGGATKKIALVGKAVTFDTGGYNLKAGATSGIASMKMDMAGSGAVLGTAAAIGRLRPDNVEVHFIMPACENMVSDRAIHPGDILTASNGKTVEVMNTDAEGRLCLADALVYAENLGDMDLIVDIATLTGAIVVSLGNEVAGFWTPCDEVAAQVTEAGKASGEELWRMPLVSSYAEQLKSKAADLRNIGTGRGGSSITAALFLQEFVKLDKWTHIDIAGTAWSEKKGGPTGYGVKTMLNLVESFTK